MIRTTLAVAAFAAGTQAGVICYRNDSAGPAPTASLQVILVHRAPLFAQMPFQTDPFAEIFVAHPMDGVFLKAREEAASHSTPAMIIDAEDCWLSGHRSNQPAGQLIGAIDWLAAFDGR